jgi:hypothetical protein
MEKNICERCGYNNHAKFECMARKDINGNMIDDSPKEYVNLIIKDKTLIGGIIRNLKIFGNNIKKLLEVPKV